MNSRNVPSTCNMLTSPWVPTKFQWEVFRDGHMEPVENAHVPNAVPIGPKVLFFCWIPDPSNGSLCFQELVLRCVSFVLFAGCITFRISSKLRLLFVVLSRKGIRRHLKILKWVAMGFPDPTRVYLGGFKHCLCFTPQIREDVHPFWLPN